MQIKFWVSTQIYKFLNHSFNDHESQCPDVQLKQQQQQQIECEKNMNLNIHLIKF